jgi:hypothetical protein
MLNGAYRAGPTCASDIRYRPYYCCRRRVRPSSFVLATHGEGWSAARRTVDFRAWRSAARVWRRRARLAALHSGVLSVRAALFVTPPQRRFRQRAPRRPGVVPAGRGPGPPGPAECETAGAGAASHPTVMTPHEVPSVDRTARLYSYRQDCQHLQNISTHELNPGKSAFPGWRTRTQDPKDAVEHAPGGTINPLRPIAAVAKILILLLFFRHSGHRSVLAQDPLVANDPFGHR